MHDTIVSLSEQTTIEIGRYPRRLATDKDLYAALSPADDTIVTVADFKRRLDTSVKNVDDQLRNLIRVPDVTTNSMGTAIQCVQEAMNDSDLQSAMAAITADSSKNMVEKMAAVTALTKSFSGVSSMTESYKAAQKKEHCEKNGLKLTALLDKESHAGHRAEIAKLIGSQAQRGTILSYPWIIFQSIDNSNIPGGESLVRDSVMDD